MTDYRGLEQEAAVMHSMLARARDLEHWAKELRARDQFPVIVRRLVHATAAGPRRIDFPANERVADPGWDGLVEADQASAFVPGGPSGWELGTDEQVKRKADEEYAKRSRDPRGIDPTHATFVFATPRCWPGRRTWAEERSAEGLWREVRAYDSSDIEQWLESAPGVHILASRHLGLRPTGVIDLESWWSSWSESTQPRMSKALVTSGRSGMVASVHAWLAGSMPRLALAADSREEALAVFAAAVLQLTPEERERRLASIVVVEERSAFESLMNRGGCLVLVPMLHEGEPPSTHSVSGQRLLLPLDHSSVSRAQRADVVRVPRLARDEAASALMSEGLHRERAVELAGLARRSLPAFRRQLSTSPALLRPAWSGPGPARHLLPALFLGAWEGYGEADRAAVAELAGCSYEEWSDTIRPWLDGVDPPLRRVDQTWYLVSKQDAWDLLIDRIESQDLERFERLAVEVLSELDPRLDLPEKDRWMAGGLGVVPNRSQLLRSSLADTLAFLGSRREEIFPHARGTGQLVAARVVRTLFDQAGGDARVWASLGGLLSLLAEAAADEFLECVEQGLAGADPLVTKLFHESGTGPFLDAPHIGLLSALETLAWSRDHFACASLALARLAELDSGGSGFNRPMDSLRSLFLLWMPSTSASLESRLRVLDQIREKHAEQAWSLLVHLVPHAGEVVVASTQPRWRDWAPVSLDRVPREEVERSLAAVAERLIEDVSPSAQRWSDLIALLPRLPTAAFDGAIQKLRTIEMPAAERSLVWNALRELISKHRTFAHTWWAMPSAQIETLASLIGSFEPEDPVARIRWLFSQDPKLLEGRSTERHARELVLAAAREKALRSTLAENARERVLRLLAAVEEPGILGAVLGRGELLDDLEDDLLNDLASSMGDAPRAFLTGFAWGRTRRHGLEWVRSKLQGVARNWPAAGRAQLLTRLEHRPDTWELAANAGTEVADEYWRRVDPVFVQDDDRERASRELMARNRPLAAMRMWVFRGRESATPTVATVLQMLELALVKGEEHASWEDVLSDAVPGLLQVLDDASDVAESTIARLEWSYLPLLTGSQRGPRALHAVLARDPQFFVRLVEILHVSEGEAWREPDEGTRANRERASRLVRRWRCVPGKTGDEMDGPVLLDWVRRARSAFSASGRGKIGDEKIGELLSASPAGPGDIWPHPAVRRVIEDSASVELERGIWIGRFTGRGLQRRNPRAGGSAERAEADRDRVAASEIAEESPRTAAMLRRFAEGADGDAQREDRWSELHEDLS